MGLTLLVENNPRIESCYMLNLSIWLGLEVITKKKAEFAIKYLESVPPNSVQLIIVRAVIEKEETAKAIVEYVQTRGLNIPVVEIGPGKEVPGCFAHVPNSLQLKILIQSSAKALKITAKEMAEKSVPEYYPIPIQYFKVIKHSVCDIFSQDIENPGKFDLQLKKLVEIDEGTIENLIQEGVVFLYTNKIDRLKFVSNVTSELMSYIESKDLSIDEEMSAADKSMELLSQKLLLIGINEETISIAKKNMEIMRKNAKISPKLSKLLERLLNNQTSYIYKHTQILTYVGLHIVKNIDWGNADQEEKIVFLSFFHDIALETDEQAKIKSNLELKKINLDREKKTLVERHAQIAAEFVAKFPHAPMGADQLIRQHHGMLNGNGFSEHFGNNISPMAIVFIVAEETARIILSKEQGPFDSNQIVQELKQQFTTSRFTKVIDLLQTITF